MDYVLKAKNNQKIITIQQIETLVVMAIGLESRPSMCRQNLQMKVEDCPRAKRGDKSPSFIKIYLAEILRILIFQSFQNRLFGQKSSGISCLFAPIIFFTLGAIVSLRQC